MRLLVLSDIHAYAEDLERVLADADGRWDEAVVLGDIVGYGPEPSRTVDALMDLPIRSAVAGNHEAMMMRLLNGERVRASPDVVVSLKRNALELGPTHLSFLGALDLQVRAEGWAAVHGSPRDPFAYLRNARQAARAEPAMARDIVLVGHTHVPVAYVGQDGDWTEVRVNGAEQRWSVPEAAKAFINPGPVGPARDGVAGASYAIYDEASREAVWRRGI